MILPYKSGTVTFTSRFGLRTLNGKLDNHKGIDLVGTDKTLVAPCDGVVAVSTMLDRATDATRTWEWGNYIRIDTPDGLNVYMCHMSERRSGRVRPSVRVMWSVSRAPRGTPRDATCTLKSAGTA